MRLQDIWDEIGIPEEQRLQRTNEVHKHTKVGPESFQVLHDGFRKFVIFLVFNPPLQSLLDLMIAEEEELKERLLKNIESCVKELRVLYDELQLPPFEVWSLLTTSHIKAVWMLIAVLVFFCIFAKEEEGCTVLQIEKNNRTRLEVMKEHKKKRMEELKSLVANDRELCGIMRTTPYGIDKDSVPSLQHLKTFKAYLDDLTKEKVSLFVIYSNFYSK